MVSSAWHHTKPHWFPAHHQLIYQTLISSWLWRACSPPYTNQPSFFTSLICELQLQGYDTLTKHMTIPFQYIKVSATTAEDLTRYSFLPAFRANWETFHGTDRPQGFELFHSVLDQEKLQVQCSTDSWALQCLWRYLLQFGGLPPPARPSVRPILGAVIKHPLPQEVS